MVNSYTNFFHTIEHKHLAYHRDSDLLPLGLSVHLRVISRTEVQMGVQGFVQPFLELQNKLGTSSKHHLLGHSMQRDYPRHIQLC
jgi:hypothetical protein